MNLVALQASAMQTMFEVEGVAGQGPTEQVTINGTAGRALVSECTSVINALRGKTDRVKRYNLALLLSEWEEEDLEQVTPGGSVTMGEVTYKIEEQDFVKDAGVCTFFMS